MRRPGTKKRPLTIKELFWKKNYIYAVYALASSLLLISIVNNHLIRIILAFGAVISWLIALLITLSYLFLID